MHIHTVHTYTNIYCIYAHTYCTVHTYAHTYCTYVKYFKPFAGGCHQLQFTCYWACSMPLHWHWLLLVELLIGSAVGRAGLPRCAVTGGPYLNWESGSALIPACTETLSKHTCCSQHGDMLCAHACMCACVHMRVHVCMCYEIKLLWRNLLNQTV